MNDHHKRSDKSKRHTFIPRRYDHEQQKLIKQKARARRADPSRREKPRRTDWREWQEEEDELLASFEKMDTGRDRIPLVRAAPITVPGPGDAPPAEAIDGTAALVLNVQRDKSTVLLDGRPVTAELAPSFAKAPDATLAVGDEVLVTVRGENHHRIEGVRPRRTFLSRPDPGNAHRERVLAANVDVAVLVLSVHAPPFRPALIDRFLIAIGRGRVRPLLCVNKVDLLEDRSEVHDALAPFRALDVDALLVSAADGEGLAELREALTGTTCVFVGHSGVGKSSLLNAIDPDRARPTKSGRAFDGKGRHTTTSSTLVELVDGTRVIDTPGIRAFGLWDVTADGLRHEFPEFRALAPRCRFGDCTHRHEPQCAVRDAVESDAVPRARYEAYVRILASLE